MAYFYVERRASLLFNFIAADTVEEFTFVLRHSFVFERLICQAYFHPGEGESVWGGGENPR